MNNTPTIPEKADMSRPGFKGYQLEQNFSSKKFGKCPIQYILEGDQEKPRASIILNPNEQWCQSPAEALQCALTRITGTDDKDLAKEIIDRAISAMPMANGKEHNTNVVYQSLSDCEPKDSLEAKALRAMYCSICSRNAISIPSRKI